MTTPAEDPRSGEACKRCRGFGWTGASDPRPCVSCDDCHGTGTTPPAAGRGDTGSGGELVCDRRHVHGGDCYTAPEGDAARPAGDRAQPTQDRPTCACGGPCDHDGSLARERLFHTVYDLIVDHPMWIDGQGNGLDYSAEREARIGDFLDQLLALPAVVALLDAQAAVNRVEALAKAWEAEAQRHDEAEPVSTDGLARMIIAAKHCRAHARDLRHALDGTT